MKRCSKCGETKPLEQFYKNSQISDGRHPSCKACRQSDFANYRSRNREVVNERKRAAYAQNTAAQLEWNRAWRVNHRATHRLQRQSRRKLVREASDGAAFTAQEMLADWQTRGLNGCSYCPGEFESIDHIVPLSRGGKHELANLTPACVRCNCSKRDSLLEEWLPGHLERLALDEVVTKPA